MYCIATFNESTNENEKLMFEDYSKAWEYAEKNGYEKFRDTKGNEYFLWNNNNTKKFYEQQIS